MRARALWLALAAAFPAAAAAPPAAAEVLRIGASPTYPPYLGENPDGSRYGIDAELAYEICTRGQFTCQWIDTEIHQLIPALVAGEVDIVMGGIGYSVARDMVVDFTCPYQITEDAFGSLYALSAGIDLASARVAVTRQSLHDLAMADAGYDTFPVDGNVEAIEAVLTGAAEAYFGSAGVVDAHPRGGELVFIETHPIPSSGAAIAVSEDRQDLLAQIDSILADLSAEGHLADMQRRWLLEDQGDVIARCQKPAPIS